MPRIPFILAVVLTATVVLTSALASVRFYGNGVNAPDLDRVKIRVDDPANNLPGPPADVGATDFTIEFWLKGHLSDNLTGSYVGCGDGIAWIYGNIVFDRDRYNQSRKFGLSIADGWLVWGVSADYDYTICCNPGVLDGEWHHVALERRRSDGWMWLYVDGALCADADGPDGDLSYPDNGVPGNYCGGPCVNSDPFIVLGAEKHDAGTEYPSYNGLLTELRLSTGLRYTTNFVPATAPFAPDAGTAALYHFDELVGDTVHDVAGAPGGPSHGLRRFGGSPAGPEWSGDSPFSAAPGVIPSLVVTVSAAGFAVLHWPVIADADSYRVYAADSAVFSPPNEGALLGTTADTSFADSGSVLRRFYIVTAWSNP